MNRIDPLILAAGTVLALALYLLVLQVAQPDPPPTDSQRWQQAEDTWKGQRLDSQLWRQRVQERNDDQWQRDQTTLWDPLMRLKLWDHEFQRVPRP